MGLAREPSWKPHMYSCKHTEEFAEAVWGLIPSVKHQHHVATGISLVKRYPYTFLIPVIFLLLADISSITVWCHLICTCINNFGRAAVTYSMLLQKRIDKVLLYWRLICSACNGDSYIPGYFNPLDILNYPEGYFMHAGDNFYYDTSIYCSLLATCDWV